MKNIRRPMMASPAFFSCPPLHQPIRWHSNQKSGAASRSWWPKSLDNSIGDESAADAIFDQRQQDPAIPNNQKQGKIHRRPSLVIGDVISVLWSTERAFECNVILWLDKCGISFCLFLLIPAVRTTRDASALLTERSSPPWAFPCFTLSASSSLNVFQ